ncbi:MAG: CoA pyrophosphatase [Deltaproteobacteria bacterium]
MNASNTEPIQKLLDQPFQPIKHITRRLFAFNSRHPVFPTGGIDWQSASAVLFLLGRLPQSGRQAGEPCLILNKRSLNVRQPGDLCCPGGRVSRRLDAGLAVLLKLPVLHLARWPHWPLWRKTRPREAKWLRLLLTTGVRESVEEMRLNPFRLDFLGPLPAQPLVMFNRTIYPMVVWLSGQKRFYPNWEVEKIIYIPLRDLLDSARYARYRLLFEGETNAPRVNTFPCFRYEKGNKVELLWGATYRITAAFLDGVFGFVPPDLNSLPEVYGRLSRTYLNNA